MESFKINHFISDHPGMEFPWYRSLQLEEMEEIRKGMSIVFGLSSGALADDLLGFVSEMNEHGSTVEGVNAKDAGLELQPVLDLLNIMPEKKIFLNWYRYDSIDEMKTEDLFSYFEDIWYPDADDLDIFDSSLSWVLSVSHAGVISVAKTQVP